MMDYGFVYKGHERFITPWPWNYGQVTVGLRQQLAREVPLTEVRVGSAGVRGAKPQALPKSPGHQVLHSPRNAYF